MEEVFTCKSANATKQGFIFDEPVVKHLSAYHWKKDESRVKYPPCCVISTEEPYFQPG